MEQDQEKMALVVLLATSGSVAGNSLKISFVLYITKQTKINQFKNIRKAYFCVRVYINKNKHFVNYNEAKL